MRLVGLVESLAEIETGPDAPNPVQQLRERFAQKFREHQSEIELCEEGTQKKFTDKLRVLDRRNLLEVEIQRAREEEATQSLQLELRELRGEEQEVRALWLAKKFRNLDRGRALRAVSQTSLAHLSQKPQTSSSLAARLGICYVHLKFLFDQLEFQQIRETLSLLDLS